MSGSELYIEAGTVKLSDAAYVTAAVELICLAVFSSSECACVCVSVYVL